MLPVSLRSRTPLAALAFSIASLVAAADPGDVRASRFQQLAADPKLILIQGAEFDPLSTHAPFALPAEAQEARTSADGWRYRLVQLDRALTSGDIDRLELDGWHIVGEVPTNAWILRTRGEGTSAPSIGGIRWAGGVPVGMRIEPDRLLPLARAASQDRVDVIISLQPGEGAEGLKAAVAASGGDVVGLQGEGTPTVRLFATVPGNALYNLAARGEVAYISHRPQVTRRNEAEVGVVQSGDGTLPQPSSARPVWSRGITGAGQVLGHIDDPIDMSSCYFIDTVNNTPRPAHRKVVAYRGPDGAIDHGTHTAGTLAGRHSDGNLTEAGHAPDAKISHTVLGTITGFSNSASNLATSFAAAQADGAFVHSNSWGEDAATSYTTFCLDIDTFSWNNEDALVLFSVSNTTTARSPENAKNCLAVGASRAWPNIQSWASGGRGPTTDGRRKPEIYAPGESVRSAYPAPCFTLEFTGTSMACPAVTGAAALVRQYFMDGFHPGGRAASANAFTPSGALVKAVLLNATVDMTGVAGYPSNTEGWGRLLLENALYFDGDARRLVVRDMRRSQGVGLAAGEFDEYQLDVTSSTEPFKVTLAWMDPPATLGASSAAVNNLNLTVTAPDGTTVYQGNGFSGGQSTTATSPDNLNNVEMVLLNTPALGRWTVRVSAPTVSAAFGGSQGYALVASGAISEPQPPAPTGMLVR